MTRHLRFDIERTHLLVFFPQFHFKSTLSIVENIVPKGGCAFSLQDTVLPHHPFNNYCSLSFFLFFICVSFHLLNWLNFSYFSRFFASHTHHLHECLLLTLLISLQNVKQSNVNVIKSHLNTKSKKRSVIYLNITLLYKNTLSVCECMKN